MSPVNIVSWPMDWKVKWSQSSNMISTEIIVTLNLTWGSVVPDKTHVKRAINLILNFSLWKNAGHLGEIKAKEYERAIHQAKAEHGYELLAKKVRKPKTMSTWMFTALISNRAYHYLSLQQMICFILVNSGCTAFEWKPWRPIKELCMFGMKRYCRTWIIRSVLLPQQNTQRKPTQHRQTVFI